MCTPPGKGIAVDGVKQRLRNGLEEGVGFLCGTLADIPPCAADRCQLATNASTYQISLKQAFTHAEKLLRGSTRDDKVFGKVDTTNAVEAANKGLAGLGVEACNDWRHKVGTETALVEARGDEVGKGTGRDGALLSQAIHVDLVAEEVADGADVGGQASEAEEDIAVLEDLGEVIGNGEGLETKSEIAGDGNTILADHGNAGAAV